MIKKVLCFILLLIACLTVFAACGNSTTIESFVIDNEKYSSKEEIESAIQPDELAATSDVYASIYFIESPLGTKYTATWYLNGDKIKSEEKEMTTDIQGSIIYHISSEDIAAGNLKLEISSHDTIILEKDVVLK